MVLVDSKHATNDSRSDDIIVGPDLNASRSLLDKKLYRQILLPNGLRCLLIQDTLAMMHGNFYVADEDGSSDEENDSDDHTNVRKRHVSVSESDTEDDENSSEEDEGEDGLRDAAVSIVVGAGSLYDPPEVGGIAHFLEHLLFMGSKKYPDENDYESYVAKHGGTDNAWTEWECTNYSLSIPQPYLWGALDRLAQFFISPLLSTSAVDRELLSVESEFQLKHNNDTVRWQQLLCSTIDHPFNRFSWGNLKSLRDIPNKLGIDTLTELRNFYDRHYYAANMRIAIIGAYTLDELQRRVVEIFSSVPALPRSTCQLPVNPSNICSWDCLYTSPYDDAGMPWQNLPRLYKVVPVKERHQLRITWPLPCQYSHFRSKPTEFLAHLIGHEAAGSLLSYFRSMNWAVSCMAGVGEEGSQRASSHSLFTATFILSEKGVAFWKEIVSAVYEYIGMLKQYSSSFGWPDWIFEELQMINKMSYLYADELSPGELVDYIVEDMAPHYGLPPERILDGSHLFFEFDANAVHEILEHMKPENARIDLISSSFGRSCDYDTALPDAFSDTTAIPSIHVLDGDIDCDIQANKPQFEPMFGIAFWCHRIPTEIISDWNHVAMAQSPVLPLSLPTANPFVPCRFDLKLPPIHDSDHPLLNASLKLCLMVGKVKQWFPATVIQYNQKEKAFLLSYEDENEEWHQLDKEVSGSVAQDYEGTFDKKKVKFRVVSLSLPGQGAIRRYGDESDFGMTDFPAIPPSLPPSRLPQLVSDTNTLKLWFLQDRNFHRPIAEIRLQINCEKANASPLHRACADLLAELCTDAWLETSYLASVCELGSSLDSSDVGFSFRYHGFDDKLLTLLETTMRIFLSFRGQNKLPNGINMNRFEACLETLCRRYKNNGMDASKLSNSLRLQALRSNIWSANQKMKSLKGINIAMFAETVSSILGKFAIEAFYHGNIDRKDAIKAKELIYELVGDRTSGNDGLSRKMYPTQTVFNLPLTKTPMLLRVPSKDFTEPNTAVELYIQVGKDNLRERVMIELLIHLMDEVFFDRLRTKLQLGYDVHCDLRWTYGITGMIFKVVTNVKSANDALAEIENFLLEYRKTLHDMTEKEFLERVVGLASQKLDMFNSLSEETDTLWSEIRDGRFEWQAWRDETICLRDIKKVDMMDAYDKWLVPMNQRKALVVQVIGYGSGESSLERPVVEDVSHGDFVDQQISRMHTLCKNQVWGRVNSKLF